MPSRDGARRSAARLAAVLGSAAGMLLTLPSLVLAASPTPGPGDAGDPRSSGQGPGLVGDPLTAILVVVAIGVVALLATLAYVRLTGGAAGDRT
jgi:hypothetical protein